MALTNRCDRGWSIVNAVNLDPVWHAFSLSVSTRQTGFCCWQTQSNPDSLFSFSSKGLIMQSQILQLDIQGTPQAWISPEQAALHLSTDDVAWAIGESDPLTVLRGGYNSRLQRQSSLAIPPIIALRGQARVNLFEVEPTVTRRKLFAREPLHLRLLW
jgi:hypothetical protein